MPILLDITNNVCTNFIPSLEILGYDYILWNEREKPSFDVFYENNPEFFISRADCSSATKKCLNKYQTPHIMFDKEEIWLVEHNLYGSKPDLDESFKSHIFFCGLPHDWVLPLCYPVGKYDIKLAGERTWPGNLPQYIGNINVEDKRNFFASASIVVAPTVETAMQAVVAGQHSIIISLDDDVEEIFGDAMCVANNSEELVNLVENLPENQLKKQKEIVSKHTYTHFLTQNMEV